MGSSIRITTTRALSTGAWQIAYVTRMSMHTHDPYSHILTIYGEKAWSESIGDF